VPAQPPPAVTIPHEELDGSPTEGFDDKGFRAERQLVCAWADRFDLQDQLLGQAVIDQTGNTTYIRPSDYPHKPGLAYAISAAAEPFSGKCLPAGGNLNLASYTQALVRVQYGSRTGAGGGGGGDGGGEPFIEETVEPFAEFLTYSPVGLHWGSNLGPLLKDDEAPGKLIKGFNWNYTRHRMLTIPVVYWNLISKVNDSPITSLTLGITFPAETLLFNPPRLARQVTSIGSSTYGVAWTVSLLMTYKPDGWNKFWRGQDNGWQSIYAVAGVVKPYTPAAFVI
jgi:hypothetical protein